MSVFCPYYDVVLKFYQCSNTCISRSAWQTNVTSLYWLLSHPVKRRESASGAYCSTQKNLWQIEIKFTFQVKKVKPFAPRRPKSARPSCRVLLLKMNSETLQRKGRISRCVELKKDLIVWRTLQRLRQISEHLRTIWRHPYFLPLLKIDEEKRRSLRGCYCYEIYCVLFRN